MTPAFRTVFNHIHKISLPGAKPLQPALRAGISCTRESSMQFLRILNLTEERIFLDKFLLKYLANGMLVALKAE